MTAEYRMKWKYIVECRARGYPQQIVAEIRDAKDKKEILQIMKKAGKSTE